MLCFFHIGSRWGLPSNESDRKDGDRMEELYKEMYLHLCRTMSVLVEVNEKLAQKIECSIDKSKEMYMMHLEAQAQENRADIEQRFNKLFKDL